MQTNISVDMWEPHPKEFRSYADELTALGITWKSSTGSPATDTLLFYDVSGPVDDLPAERYSVMKNCPTQKGMDS